MSPAWCEHHQFADGQICQFSQQKFSPAGTRDTEYGQITASSSDPPEDDSWLQQTRSQSRNPMRLSLSLTLMAGSIYEGPQKPLP